jgi:hypothetical protein
MTYAQFGLIQATDYNGFVTTVNNLWGTGSGDSGYGQSTTLSSVAASNTVTASQWSTLIARMNSMRQHQAGSGVTTGLTSPNTGDTIAYLSTLSSSLNTISGSRLVAAAVGTEVGATAITNTATWGGIAVKEASYTWSSANAMRYFFNAGGYVQFTGVNSFFSGTTKSTDWNTLVDNCGTIRIKAQSSEKIGGGGSPSVYNTNLGFYDLPISYTPEPQAIILRQYSPTATGGYNLNYATFEARLNAAAGSSTILYMRMTLTDADPDLSGAPADTIIGTAQFDYSHTPPSTAFLSNVWGGVTATALVNTQ